MQWYMLAVIVIPAGYAVAKTDTHTTIKQIFKVSNNAPTQKDMIANTAEEPENEMEETDVGDVSRHVMIVTKTETDTVTVAGVRKYVNIAKIQQVR